MGMRGMRDLERAILADAKQVFNNKKLRLKDLMEWSTGKIESRDDEVVAVMPDGINVAIKKEHDKRKVTGA